jgi:hypothetical protein
MVVADQAGGESSWLADSPGLMAAGPAGMIVQVAGWSRGEESLMGHYVKMP